MTMRQTRLARSQSRRSLRSTLAFAIALAFSLPALATDVVQVRVGKHPTFSRVVFELDQPAGYRVEQRGSGSDSSLVITLEAGSRARSIRSGSAGIAGVEVGASQGQSVATVKLRKSGLRFKEMILANPPRIVLDVLIDEPSLMAAKPKPAAPKVAVAKPVPTPTPAVKPAPKPAPAPVAKTVKPAPKPEPIAEAVKPAPAPIAKTVKPAPAPVAKTVKPAPKPEPIAEAVKPAPAPVAKTVKPAPKPEPIAEAVKPAPKLEPIAKTVEPAPVPVVKTPEPVAETPAPAPKPIAVAEPIKPEPTPPAIEKPAAPESAPAPDALAKAAIEAIRSHVPSAGEAPTDKTAAAEALRKRLAEAAHSKALRERETAKASAAAKSAQPAPSRESADAKAGPLSNPIVLGAAAGILLCLVGFVVLVRRRRPLPNDLDVTAIADETDAPPSPFSTSSDVSSDQSETSFTGLFDETEADESPTFQTEHERERERTMEMPAPPSEATVANEIDSLFDAADAELAPKGDDSMNQGTSDLPADVGHTASAPKNSPAPARSSGASPDPDVLRVVHELERRMAKLEGKLDEANEARERLERQVAAQSEELRVQRAAIARTQRALRTMSRGDDDKATEPALREGGDTQAKTRVNV